MSEQPYYRWRAFCGHSLLMYALKLSKNQQSVLLRHLYECISRHAATNYGVENVVLAPEADNAAFVRAIAVLSCKVRNSPRFQREVHEITDPVVFAQHLAGALSYIAGEQNEDIAQAREKQVHLVAGCVGAGHLFLEKHIPDVENADAGRPYRRLYIYNGSLHALICEFLMRFPEHEQKMYELLQKALKKHSKHHAKMTQNIDADAEEVAEGLPCVSDAIRAANDSAEARGEEANDDETSSSSSF